MHSVHTGAWPFTRALPSRKIPGPDRKNLTGVYILRLRVEIAPVRLYGYRAY